MLMWRFGRDDWDAVTYSQCPALDAAARLELAGLVQEAICHCGCGRAIIQLTERGIRFVERMDKPTMPSATVRAGELHEMVPVSSIAPMGALSQGPWIVRFLRRFFAAESGLGA